MMKYIIAGGFTAVLIWVSYLVETLSGRPAGLSSLNIAFAATTLFLLGFVLLIGPLTRFFAIFDFSAKYRKELGIMSFFTATSHTYLTLVPLSSEGIFGVFVRTPLSAYPGLEAYIIVSALFFLSTSASMHVLGTKLWWSIHNWGVRVAFVLVAVHVLVMRLPSLISWAFPETGRSVSEGVYLPPLYVWEILFIMVVILIRLSELFPPKLSRLMAYLGLAASTGILILGTLAQ